MHELRKKNIGKVVTSKFVQTGPSFYKKIIYRAVVSQRLRNTAVEVPTRFLSYILLEFDQPTNNR